MLHRWCPASFHLRNPPPRRGVPPGGASQLGRGFWRDSRKNSGKCLQIVFSQTAQLEERSLPPGGPRPSVRPERRCTRVNTHWGGGRAEKWSTGLIQVSGFLSGGGRHSVQHSGTKQFQPWGGSSSRSGSRALQAGKVFLTQNWLKTGGKWAAQGRLPGRNHPVSKLIICEQKVGSPVFFFNCT